VGAQLVRLGWRPPGLSVPLPPLSSLLHKNPEDRRWGNPARSQHSPMLRQKADCFFWYRPTWVVPEQRLWLLFVGRIFASCMMIDPVVCARYIYVTDIQTDSHITIANAAPVHCIEWQKTILYSTVQTRFRCALMCTDFLPYVWILKSSYFAHISHVVDFCCICKS